MNKELNTALYDHIHLAVRAGYDDRETIIVAAYALFHDDYEDVHELRRLVARLTDSALSQHHAEQRAWNHVTDVDKLDEAFAELDRSGIVARQNFTCCQTCGHTEIGYEIGKATVHRTVRGYVFFHAQDTESVVGRDVLYLAYGTPDGNEDDSVQIGHEVVATLRRHGLSVEWDGTIQKRICIKNIHWQRRRLTRLFDWHRGI